MVNRKIPLDSPEFAAAQAILSAVRNSDVDGVSVTDAVDVHISQLDRGQLADVIGLLAGALFIVRDALRKAMTDVE